MLHIGHSELHQPIPHLLNDLMGSHQVVTVTGTGEDNASSPPRDALNGNSQISSVAAAPSDNTLDGWL